MIENEFLFLGLLAEGPKHGYEIKRQIEKELVPAIGLQIKSIYYPLKKMEEAGLVEKEVGPQQGRFPQKYIYRITSKGKKQFEELVTSSFLSVERPYFEMDLSLYFLPLVDQALAKKGLRTRLIILKKIRKDLLVIKNLPSQSKPLELILLHDLDLVEAEIASTERLITQL
ncbi:MAG: PadR family transcriptional regulator [Candidatus Omnitrophica bacterium]|nr:PadR family transcriptional regulator [Candidatus Omnitrophota bacterium]